MYRHAAVAKEVSSSANSRSGFAPWTELNMSSTFQNALSLHQQNRLVEAERCYKQILQIEPDHAGALHFLGVIFLARRDYGVAVEYLEKALRQCDTKAVYFNNYGVALLKLGRTEDARVSFQQALDLCPDHPDALYNMGLVCMESRDYDCAEKQFHKLVDQVDYPHAVPLLIEVSCRKKEYEKAFDVYSRFRDSSKIDPETMDKIAALFHDGKQYDFMIKVVNDAVRTGGETAQRSLFLAWGYGENGVIHRAKKHFLKAAKLRSGRPFWKYKHMGLCPIVFSDNAEIEEYWSELNASLDDAVSDSPLMEIRHVFEDGVMPSFNLPHLMNCCRGVKEKFARLVRPSFKDFQPPKLEKMGKIRIAFFVSEGHQGGCLRSDTGLMKRLDRNRFEPVFITGRNVIDLCRRDIKSDDIEFVGISPNFEEAAQQIRETKCHILYHWQTCSDLMNYLIPFAKCAPIQIAGFGMHGTSGTEEVDYFMSSRYLEPDPGDDHYTEHLIRFEEFATWQTRICKARCQASRNDFNFPKSGAIYFCPHRLPKFHPDFDPFLKDILETDTQGHIVMLAGGNKYAVEKLRARWEKTLGKDLMKRILTRPQMNPRDYYRMISVSSCILDSPCYSTSFTGLDALALGVPLIGIQGPIMVQRYASAFYKRMNLEEFIPVNRDEYVTLATTISNDNDFKDHFLKLVDERKEVFFENPKVISLFENELERVYSETDFRAPDII